MNLRTKKYKLYILKNREKNDPKKKQNLSDLWDNVEQCNVCVIGVPAGEAKENEAENLFEETMKHIPRFVNVH